MSWFSNSQINIDQLVKEATDESIPNGELDIVKALEITDLIRSKKVPAKDTMRSLKKRLISTRNPNTQLSTLELIDSCVKNGGSHFISEISSREFLDSLNSKIIQDDTHVSEVVKKKALKLIQQWALVFHGSLEYKYFQNAYQNLKNQGYVFPEVTSDANGTALFDSNVPPEWEDSDACMICSNKFSLLNRKHHCRNCGGVYCSEHSSKTIDLPDLGISEPVRVCDNCYDEIKSKKKSGKKHKKKNQNVVKARLEYDSDDDEDLKRALELSLKDSQPQAYLPQIDPVIQPAEISKPGDVEDDDEDLKAAIAASLKDLEDSKPKETTNDAYANLLPQSSQPYQQTYTPAHTQEQSYQQGNNYQPQQYSQQQNAQQNAQQVPQQQVQAPVSVPNRLAAHEENAIRQFTVKTIDAANRQGPAEIQELTEYYKKAIPLQPKLVNELNDSIYKYDEFVDLNFKIDNIMRLYNKILDDRIDRESRGYSQYHQPQPQQTGYYNSSQHQAHEQTVNAPQSIPDPYRYAPPSNQQSPVVQHSSPFVVSHQNTGQQELQTPIEQPIEPKSPVHQYTESEPSYPSYEQYGNHVPNESAEGEEYAYPDSNESLRDPFEDPQEEEDEYSAPPPPVQLSAQPTADSEQNGLTQNPIVTGDSYQSLQTHSGQQLHRQNKITDFNFPSVPSKRVEPEYPEQPIAAEPIVQPKEELLIEL